MTSSERQRVETFGKLEDGLRQASDWYLWGPYVSERQWGTVREDYSADGEAWDYLPHDHARSRAYRWGEDGMAGFSDVEQRLCLGLALWNGRDPILKERMFGLTGAQGNHGEDVKEYWWYLDALPSHAWNRWRYHYPQGAFPYEELIDENARRGKHDMEYELLDTGAFDEDRYCITEVDYAKADAHDLLMHVRVTNAGPDAETLHVLPTVWFRNTWSWDLDAPKPELRRSGDAIDIDHPFLGELELLAAAGPDGAAPVALFCENETNEARLFGVATDSLYPKDGINDHVISGSPTVNPAGRGTKAALWYRVTVEPGATVALRLRLRNRLEPKEDPELALGADFDRVITGRREEADEFYAELAGPRMTADEALVMRQAFAGMLWSKQLFNYDVGRWLDGDPTQP
ncbi:MAG: glucosidase, partial [Acidimicrobiales bacterium]